MFILMYLGAWIRALLINLTAWYVWRRQGTRVLIVYSDSTIWKGYFEEELLPRLEGRAIVLNWSQRKMWQTSIATLAFKHYGGRVEVNPAAFVFQPFSRVKVLRYYLPFKEYKRGHPERVAALTDQLFDLVEAGHVRQST